MNFEIETLQEQPVLGIRFRTSMDKIPENIGKAYGTLFGFLGQKMLPPAGPPSALYFDLQIDEADIDMEACVPVAREVEAEGDMVFHTLPAGRYATTLHKGPYDQMGPTYEAMMAWMAEQGLKPLTPVREEYLNDPGEVEPSEVMTRIVWPVE